MVGFNAIAYLVSELIFGLVFGLRQGGNGIEFSSAAKGPSGMLLPHLTKRIAFQMSTLLKILNRWVPGVACTFLGYFLSKGAFDGVGETFERSWGTTLQWGVEPIFFPRWFVLSGATTIFVGGVYLFWKQYKRLQTFERDKNKWLIR